MSDLKLSGLFTFADMVILLSQKRDKIKKGLLWVYETSILEKKFCEPHWEFICHNKRYHEISVISTPLEITARPLPSTKATLVFLPADGDTSWLLHPCLVFLLLAGTVQSEKT